MPASSEDQLVTVVRSTIEVAVAETSEEAVAAVTVAESRKLEGSEP